MISRRAFITAAAASAAGGALLLPREFAARSAADAASATANLQISLQNESGSDTVYAYISGADASGWPGFVTQDGQFHRLPNPSSSLAPSDDYSIRLNLSGGGAINVPLSAYVIGGRIWFSIGDKIQFFVNPGSVPGLVQPGLISSDPNWGTNWTFCEFTYNSTNLYANISYVDLVAFPISMQSTGSSGSQSISPLPAGALDSIASGLIDQSAVDGAPWDQLVATDSSGNTLRVLSPAHSPADFGSYWDSYVSSVWNHYASAPLTIDTQSFGTFTGTVAGGALTFAGLNDNGVPFTPPSAADIFSCNSGPLYNSGSDARGAVAARLAAALNRSTLLVNGGDKQPDVQFAQYYQEATTNHFARLVHQYATVGYAFPYDDVGPTGSAPVDGHLQDFAPTSWTVTVGNGSGGGGSDKSGADDESGGGDTVDAYSTIQATSYTSQSSTQTEASTDTGGGGENVGWISSGDWLGYARVDFGSASPTQFLARVASGAASGVSGAIEVRLDSKAGTPIAVVNVANTGGWQSWKTVPMNISGTVTGVHDVYLTFSSGSGSDFVNLRWFTFSHT
ncbi:beta-1,3-glucanase family protein [Streptomyces tendae]|uniref:beta-1,3-glucanase family protein n=1 Tax=Streptomyces tendae TaxID=1932 RepID=UPI0033F7BE6B